MALLRKEFFVFVIFTFLSSLTSSCSESRSDGYVVMSAEEARALPENTQRVDIDAASLPDFKDIVAGLKEHRIKELRMNSTLVDEEGFQGIGALDSLETLDILATQGFNEGCVKHIINLDNLRTLRIAEVDVSDSALHEFVYHGPSDRFVLGHISSHHTRPTRRAFLELEVSEIKLIEIVLDVSWVSDKSKVLSKDDLTKLNEAAGRSLFVVRNTD